MHNALIDENGHQALFGYLKTVAQLECQALTQTRLISKLNSQCTSLGKNRILEKPKKPEWELLSIHGLGYENIDVKVSVILKSLPGLILMIVLLAACFASVSIKGFFWLLPAVIAGPIMVFLISIVYSRHEYRRRVKEYNLETKEYNKQAQVDKNRLACENKAKAALQLQLQSVKQERQKTMSSLKALYSLGIVHSDYCSLVPISAFCDYFDKGICTQLTGRDGAYAFYEEALRFHKIETKLDIIIDKLDEIASNQRYIAELIQNGNDALYRIEKQNQTILRNVDNIGKNVALTEYNTHCAAQSLAAMEAIETYRFIRYS